MERIWIKNAGLESIRAGTRIKRIERKAEIKGSIWTRKSLEKRNGGKTTQRTKIETEKEIGNERKIKRETEIRATHERTGTIAKGKTSLGTNTRTEIGAGSEAGESSSTVGPTRTRRGREIPIPKNEKRQRWRPM